jgi:hypothetical protein
VRRLVVLLLLAALVAGGALAAATLSILGDDTPAVGQAAREARDRVAGTAREGADRARDRVERAAPAPSVRKARCPRDAEGRVPRGARADRLRRAGRPRRVTGTCTSSWPTGPSPLPG